MTTPATPYIQACTPENMQQDGTCSVPVWLPYPQSPWPVLDLADGTLVALSIVGVWAIGVTARLIFRAARMGNF